MDVTQPTQVINELFSGDQPIVTAPILSPSLDPRNEKQLVEDAIALVGEKSQGQLNDFTPGSPTRALIEGQALVGAQLAFLANQVAHKAAIDFLQIAGVQRIVGKSARASLFFRISAPVTSVFKISAGLQVRADSVIFQTDQDLIINQGATTGRATAFCTTVGTEGNVRANTITAPLQSFAFLESVTNPLPASGGENGETEAQTLSRGFLSLRTRGLVSRWDYENFVRQVLGGDIVVRAFGRITPDNRFSTLPSVTIAACHKDGSPLSSDEEFKLGTAIEQRKHPTVVHNYRPLTVTRIDIQAIVEIRANANARDVATLIWEDYQEFLGISERWNQAHLVSNELESRIYRFSDQGVSQVTFLFFGVANTGLINRDSYHTERFETLGINNLILTLVQGGKNFVIPFGPGDPD